MEKFISDTTLFQVITDNDFDRFCNMVSDRYPNILIYPNETHLILFKTKLPYDQIKDKKPFTLNFKNELTVWIEAHAVSDFEKKTGDFSSNTFSIFYLLMEYGFHQAIDFILRHASKEYHPFFTFQILKFNKKSIIRKLHNHEIDVIKLFTKYINSIKDKDGLDYNFINNYSTFGAKFSDLNDDSLFDAFLYYLNISNNEFDPSDEVLAFILNKMNKKQKNQLLAHLIWLFEIRVVIYYHGHRGLSFINKRV